MNKRGVRLLALACAVSVATGCKFAMDWDSNNFVVSGWTVDNQNKPLPDTTVSFGALGSTTSDNEGVWLVRMGSSATASASLPGFKFQPETVEVSREHATVTFHGTKIPPSEMYVKLINPSVSYTLSGGYGSWMYQYNWKAVIDNFSSSTRLLRLVLDYINDTNTLASKQRTTTTVTVEPWSKSKPITGADEYNYLAGTVRFSAQEQIDGKWVEVAKSNATPL